MIGYAFTGSFCTIGRSLAALEKIIDTGVEVQPIMSETVWSTDTRFFTAEDLVCRVRALCGREVIHTRDGAEPIGTRRLDALIIAPCTGNTLAKLAHGITDTAVTMAAKAHLRCDGKILIAPASNDALSQNLRNIGTLVTHKSVYMLPMCQDDPVGKPHSLVADFSLLPEALAAMNEGHRLRPMFR